MAKSNTYIINEIESKGYCIIENALPHDLTQALQQHVRSLPEQTFQQAGIGREENKQVKLEYRNDRIHWLEEKNSIENEYLAWMEALRSDINEQLYMGLFEYEAHFAHYPPQSFYKRHLDAFSSEANNGNTNRKLSTVFYLNPDWQAENGGELAIYTNNNSDKAFQHITPNLGTLVVFLSEDFPHEVLPAQKDRYSIAGWFRLKA